MPLDSTASIKDIITALQTMEGIDAKADLASVVGSPATAGDTMATLVSLIQSSKNELATKMDDGSTGVEPLETLVGNLVMGKKWASGTSSRVAQKLFPDENGVNSSSYYTVLDFSTLDFVPSLVFISNENKTLNAPSTIWSFSNTYENGGTYANCQVAGKWFRTPFANGLVEIPVNANSLTPKWRAFE